MKSRKALAAAASAAGMMVLILDSRTALSGGVQGVELCLRSVIPSLFPFLFLSGCFSSAFSGVKTGSLRVLGSAFSLPAGMEYLLIPAFLGGYPIGAQSVAQAYESGSVSREQAEHLLGYCSNVGPAFVFGMVSSQFDRTWMVWAIWGIQIGAAWTASRFLSCQVSSSQENRKPQPGSPFSIETAITAMLKISGWIILFRIAAGFLERWFLWRIPAWERVGIVGLLELANGCCCLNMVSEEGIRFLVCNLILAFGGLCVAYQTASVCGNLGLRYYFLGKGLQAGVAVLLAAGVYDRMWFLFPIWFALTILLPKVLKKRVEIRQGLVYNEGRKNGGLSYAVSQKD